MRHLIVFFATFVAWALIALFVSILTGSVTLGAYVVTSQSAARLLGTDAHNVSGAVGILAFLLCCIGIAMAMLTVRAEIAEAQRRELKPSEPKPPRGAPLPGSTRPLP